MPTQLVPPMTMTGIERERALDDIRDGVLSRDFRRCEDCAHSHWLRSTYASDNYRALVKEMDCEVGWCGLDGLALTSDDTAWTIECDEFETVD